MCQHESTRLVWRLRAFSTLARLLALLCRRGDALHPLHRVGAELPLGVVGQRASKAGVNRLFTVEGVADDAAGVGASVPG